ncbi:MAG: arylsulfotransferase family protein [Egibacteraceae bacterium]
MDDAGEVLHAWSHTAEQPRPEDDSPNNLRGWNHVAVDADGSLLAVVPLQALLKLTPDSDLEWSCDVAAHHDLAIEDSGALLVLTEAPRLVAVGGHPHVILDNFVTVLDPGGAVKTEVSLYDVLRTDPTLRRLIDQSARRRREEFRRRGWPTPEDDVAPEVVRHTRAILSTGSYEGERRQALRRLRSLPGSPCDILHTNTLELLDAHSAGLWERGDVMLCMRELNTVAVVDLTRATVRWSWGGDQLSGPHQPSVLPDGRVLVFDNGVRLHRTRVVAVDPSTRNVRWSWSAEPPESFFCPLAGGCEPLANGNVLVTNSTAGAAFELNMDGQIVWQLTLPVEVYGADRGRVSIYRMSVVGPDVVKRLQQGHESQDPAARPQATNSGPLTAPTDQSHGCACEY